MSYYLHSILESVGITSSYDQTVINGGLQIWSFLVAVGFAFAVDKVGRRKLFLIAAIGMLISFTIWTAYVIILSICPVLKLTHPKTGVLLYTQRLGVRKQVAPSLQ